MDLRKETSRLEPRLIEHQTDGRSNRDRSPRRQVTSSSQGVPTARNTPMKNSVTSSPSR